jgi:hypothetical protein
MTDSEFREHDRIDHHVETIDAPVLPSTRAQLYEVVKAARQNAGDNDDKARDIIVGQLSADPDLLERYFAVILREWARWAVGQLRRDDRAAVTGGLSRAALQAEQQESARQRMVRSGLSIAASYLNDYKVGGKPLGDCTKDDLTAEIAAYHSRARDNSIRARWLSDVRAKIGDKVVRDVLNDAQIEKLFRKAEAV